MFLVVMDAHSKWLEVVPMKIATAFNTIQHLRQLFAQFGIPESVVSDNGPQFVAEEFRKFCEVNGIRHIRVAAYHPSSNGLAERGVQIFKQDFAKPQVARCMTDLPDFFPLQTYTTFNDRSFTSRVALRS